MTRGTWGFVLVLMLLPVSWGSVPHQRNATGRSLREELHHEIINSRKQLTYAQVWLAMQDIDDGLFECADGTIHDYYSSKCWLPGAAPGERCGTYRQEGDCWNREHSWPVSWWGGGQPNGKGAYTDMVHLVPSDGYVNGVRANYPFGIVTGTPTYVSSNGAKLGPCVVREWSGTCFEPPSKFKGDFARIYFYMATAYLHQWTCCETEGTDRYNLKAWTEVLMRSWHAADPVDAMEMHRNKGVAHWQHSDNPFVSNPHFVDLIDEF